VERLEALAVVPRLEAVGLWYRRFEQLDDAAVLQLLAEAPPLSPS
jgi:predicted phosphoribosyltransferase